MAQAYKIPRGGNYPPLHNMVPQWWDPTLTTVPGSDPNVVGSGLDSYVAQYGDLTETLAERRFADPRWMGAFKKSFDTQVDLRAVCFDHPVGPATTVAGKYLYLSWYIKFHMDATAAYAPSWVAVGFKPGTAGVSPVVFRITLQAGTNTGTVPEGLGSSGFTIASATHSEGTWSSASAASWVTTETRVWTMAGGAWWAVHMRVPVTPLTAGVDLRGTFGMALWAEPDWHDTVPSFRWPNAVDPNPLASDPSTFQLCYLEVDAPTAGDTPLNAGVSLAENKIGTTGVSVTKPGGGSIASPQAINAHAGTPNNFFATPKNENPSSSVPANTITARFRLGNFGSSPALPTGAGWKTLGESNSHPLIAANGAEETINFTWTPTAADESFYNTPAHFHQCILVELSSADSGITFLNESAARNMDFGYASKFTREVEVTVAGLKDGYLLANRDVYIYVERINVPVEMDDATRKKYEQVRETLRAVTNVEGNFLPESRYASIVKGDMRHLRLIDFGHFVEWLRNSFRKRELIVRDPVFDLLRKLDVNATNPIELIDLYFDQIRDRLPRLTYNNEGQPEFSQGTRQIVDVLVSNTVYVGPTAPAVHPLPPMEELQRYMPTVRYHVYHDTGRISTLNGVNRPVLEVQPSFGYYLWLDHDVRSWELRLHGAQKLRENVYLIRPPTEGSVRITTSIHAVQQGEENQIEPPEEIVPFPQYPRKEEKTGCRTLLKKLLGLG